MGPASVLWVLCSALTLFSLDASAARNRPRKLLHDQNPTKEYLRYQSSHDHLLGGAGCEVPLPPEVTAPKKNIWLGLTGKDNEEVQKWLYKQKELNLTRTVGFSYGVGYGNGPGSNQNRILNVDSMPPNKTDVCRAFSFPYQVLFTIPVECWDETGSVSDSRAYHSCLRL